MREERFEEQLALLYKEFGPGRTMVLSTSENGRVSSRMMSIVRLGDMFCFQTDIRLRKYAQLKQNEHVALCADNIQIEGICAEAGRPLDNAPFCEAFQACFPGSFKAYSALEGERLFTVKPLYIERWVYRDGAPYMETFDPVSRRYSLERYGGC